MALSPEEYERAQVARLTGYRVNSDDIGRLVRIEAAAKAILDDVRKRHPGEELYYYYPHMPALDEAIQS